MPLSDLRTTQLLTSEDLGISTGQLIPFAHTFTEDTLDPNFFKLAQLLYVTNIYSADATVITRQPSCSITTPSGQLAWNMVSSSVITASQTEQVYWPQGELAQGFLFAAIPIKLARQFYIKPGYTITFASLSTGPGDLQAPYFTLRVWR